MSGAFKNLSSDTVVLLKAGFHIIADDRKRSQSRLQPYISVSRNVKCTRALCSRQNLFSKQHSGHRGENFPASKFTSSFSPEETASSASKAKETSVLSSKNIHEETKTWGFPHTLLRELRVSDRTVTNIQALLLRSFESFESELKLLWDTFRSQIAELGFHMIAGSQTIADDRRRSQTIANDRRSGFPYDRRRSQNFLRSTIYDLRFARGFAIVCDHMETSLK